MTLQKKLLALLVAIVATNTGCATTGAVQAVGTAVNIAMQLSGIKTDAGNKEQKGVEVPMRISAGKELNTTPSGHSLSLVVRVYQLRNGRAFGELPYPAASGDDAGKAVLGEDLVAVEDVVLIPGKNYDLTQKLTADSTTIGVVGLFRSPARRRWKLTFDAVASQETGITVGAHACALTAGRGVVSGAQPADQSRTLSGVSCDG
ncbi:MAG: type VI secretion system lipoprotein TssJ [Denitromonas halophila]|nr:MAG: type VI secretion system lipoprotein TssJ [Denitromonas halophila]